MQMYWSVCSKSIPRYDHLFLESLEIEMITIAVWVCVRCRADWAKWVSHPINCVCVTDGKSQLHRMRSHRHISARCYTTDSLDSLWLLVMLLGGFNSTHWLFNLLQSHRFLSAFFRMFIYLCVFSRFPVHFHKCTYCFELADKYAP